MGWWTRLARTFHPGRHNDDIDEELAYHLAMRECDGRDGRAARIRFGNVSRLKEETRAQGIVDWIESLLRDLRYAVRQYRQNAVLTAVVILSLALGIGANSAIFNVVDAALLKPLPVEDPQKLRLTEWTTEKGWPDALCKMLTGDSEGDWDGVMKGSSIARRIYVELSEKQSGFASIAGFSDSDKAGIASKGRPAEQCQLQYVSPNFFSTLGVPLELGRTFSRNEDRPGAPPLVIISDRFWRKWFGGSGDVLGQALRVNNVEATVIGVAPPSFFGLQIGQWVDLYAPLTAHMVLSPQARLNDSFGDADTHWWVRVIGRLKPDINEAQATGQVSALFRQLVVPEGTHVDANKMPRLIATPGARGFDPVGTDSSRAMWISLLLVGLILLIVCANVANLLLSRAITRRREFAVCLALGAARTRLFRQYLVESVTLAAAGGAAGLWLSHVLANAIQSFLETNLAIGGFDLHVGWRIIIFTSLVSLLTALLFGVAPAVLLATARVNDALKARNRAVLSGRLRLPRILVITQIALSFTVLLSAGLLGRSLANLRAVDLGFNRTNLVYASLNPWSAGYDAERIASYVQQMRERLTSIPGVLRVAVIEERPISGNANITMPNIPGRPYREGWSDGVLLNHVSDGVFETLGIPLLAGRTFNGADLRPHADTVIVDNLFVRRFYPHRNPIGEQFGTGPTPKELYRIIGVVKKTRYRDLREENDPVIFLPSGTPNPGSNINFVIRAAVDVNRLARPIQKAATAVDPAVPVVEIRSQTALINHRLLNERLLAILSGAFGGLALLLSAIGLIGLLAYMVARRTNEIGVRMALGASQRDVVRMVLRDALGLVTAGILAGVPGAFLMGRLLKHTLFNLHGADPRTATMTLAILGAVAGLAAWAPANRAARIDPMVALREE